jgi:methanogenic corrinoid protein MtbC1
MASLSDNDLRSGDDRTQPVQERESDRAAQGSAEPERGPVDALAWNEAPSQNAAQAMARAVRHARETPTVAAALHRETQRKIIPRLLLAHDTGPERRMPATAATMGRGRNARARMPTDIDVGDFMQLAREPHFGAAYDLVLDLRARGVSSERILLDLMAPAARRLGDLWYNDECDFTEVTLALSRMHRVLHELRSSFDHESVPRHGVQQILLCPTPGEQHTFGLLVVEEFFRRSGWLVNCEAMVTTADIVDRVRTTRFSAIGLSLSSEVLLDELALVIRRVRRYSRNRDIGVLVGGSLFLERPELVIQVGADATALDGRHAVRQTERLLKLMA